MAELSRAPVKAPDTQDPVRLGRSHGTRRQRESAPEHGAQISTSSKNAAGAMAEAARLFTEGAFTLPVEGTFPLEEAPKAQAMSEAGHVAGRFVVTVP